MKKPPASHIPARPAPTAAPRSPAALAPPRPAIGSPALSWTTSYTSGVSNRRRIFLVPTVATCVLLTAVLSFGKPSTTPARPAALPGASASATPAPDLTALQKAQRGVVILERAGRAIGLGAVLATDGRILTALSAVGDGNNIDARYADGSIVNVRVGHSDRAWDLALLVPQAGRWPDGLGATTSDPMQAGTQLRTFTQRNRQVRVASVVLKGRGELLGGDAEVLRDALQISTQLPASDIGAPLVDGNGQVMAIVARACVPAEGAASKPCRPSVFGAPVEVLKQFLRSAPANAIPPSPWLGIQGVAAETPIARGVRVVGIHPDSPASQAGLQGADDPGRADVIVAVDGVPVPSPEKLAELVRDRAVGDTVELIVLRQGRFQVLKVTLKGAPAPGSRSN